MITYIRTNEMLPDFLKRTGSQLRVHWDEGGQVFKALAYDPDNAQSGMGANKDVFIAIRSAMIMLEERPYPMETHIHRGT